MTATTATHDEVIFRNKKRAALLIANWSNLDVDLLGKAYLTEIEAWADSTWEDGHYHEAAMHVIEAIGLFRHGKTWERWVRTHINERYKPTKRPLAVA